jgi:hypothetical protein
MNSADTKTTAPLLRLAPNFGARRLYSAFWASRSGRLHCLHSRDALNACRFSSLAFSARMVTDLQALRGDPASLREPSLLIALAVNGLKHL